MDHYNAAQQHELNTMATQHMLCGLSDNPQQYREPRSSGRSGRRTAHGSSRTASP